MISQGPIVHPYYKDFNIEHYLLLEAINECEMKDKQVLLIDPLSEQHDEDQITILKEMYQGLGFNSISDINTLSFEKFLN